MGYEAPSPVQAETIPLLLAAEDVIAQALTGTGKTAAFGIPIVERSDPKNPSPQALILTPTRELAIQVAGEISRIGHFKKVCVLPIYGGQPYDRQIRVLREGVQVVVATPGRLMDLVNRGALKLDQVGTLILDEADEMLNMGFLDDVEQIISYLPDERQTALFSATMPPQIVELSRRHLKNPKRVILSTKEALTAPDVDQFYYQVPRPYKIEALTRLMDLKNPTLALVFCATKRMVDDLNEELLGRGYRVESLHGDMSQAQRERVIGNARNGRLDVLVATDVAARGIDIPEISHVFNFDLPQDPEYYVHRIGRTGRAGRTGEALTLVAPWEARELRVIERATGATIKRGEVPTIDDLERREQANLGQRIEALLSSDDWTRYRDVVEGLIERHDPTQIAAAALALAAGPIKTRRDIPESRPLAEGGGDRGRDRRPRPGRSRREWDNDGDRRRHRTVWRPDDGGQFPRDGEWEAERRRPDRSFGGDRPRRGGFARGYR
ncbi:MAG: DEAD/DEAH box helicase [Chloroflexi bacterium]|nr:DEAD/DEAH box helicase [Chloroflexota bacterium]